MVDRSAENALKALDDLLSSAPGAPAYILSPNLDVSKCPRCGADTEACALVEDTRRPTCYRCRECDTHLKPTGDETELGEGGWECPACGNDTYDHRKGKIRCARCHELIETCCD